MIPHRSNDVKVIGQISDRQKLQVAPTPELYNLLSSQIYSRPDEAVIRELLTNARDEHVETGCTKPIDVHLPTVLEPWFSVTDYGRGMTPEKVHDVYLTYGASSKLKSNDFVGQLGIGAKSPLTLTDQFTTITRTNGIEYEWLIYKSEDGCPVCQLVNERKVAQQSGTTVSVPIPSDTTKHFSKAFKKFMQFFDWEVNVVNQKDYQLPNPFFMELEHGYIAKDRFDDFYAVMGGVAYQFSASEITWNEDSFQGLLARYGFPLYYSTIALKFDIGEFSFSASRETVEYTDRTKKAIYEKAKLFFEELTEVVDKRAQEIISDEGAPFWERVHHLHELKKRVNKVFESDYVEYGKRKIPLNCHVEDIERKKKGSVVYKYILVEQVTDILSRRYHSCSAPGTRFHNAVFVYMNSKATRKVERLKQIQEMNPGKNIIIFKSSPHVVNEGAIIPRIEKYYRIQGVIDLKDVELPKKYSSSRTKRSTDVEKYYFYNRNRSVSQFDPLAKNDFLTFLDTSEKPILVGKIKWSTVYINDGKEKVRPHDLNMISSLYSIVGIRDQKEYEKYSKKYQSLDDFMRKASELQRCPKFNRRMNLYKSMLQAIPRSYWESVSRLKKLSRRSKRELALCLAFEKQFNENLFRYLQLRAYVHYASVVRDDIREHYSLLTRTYDESILSEMIEFYHWKDNKEENENE